MARIVESSRKRRRKSNTGIAEGDGDTIAVVPRRAITVQVPLREPHMKDNIGNQRHIQPQAKSMLLQNLTSYHNGITD
jgi:hypothetical protein